jgi:hypothetical protein
MIETLNILPSSFWVALALICYGMVWARGHLRDGLGFPVMAVLLTITSWYLGDALYNDYRGAYMLEFAPDVMNDAWWEVALFVGVFLILVPRVHRWVNRRELKRTSQVAQILRAGTGQPLFQHRLGQMFWACTALWAVLTVVAFFRLGSDTLYYIFPFLEDREDPWSRGRIGGGIDSLLSLASYLEMFIAGVFGTMAALLKDRRLRIFAIVGCILTWPYFLFDRTRNPMLAVVIPAILAWVFLRLRGGVLQKIIVLFACFLLVNAWLKFVMSNRSDDSIAATFRQEGFDFQKTGNVHHEGLNMYEELCWINTFIVSGLYEPNWGKRYFAELVNPVPRVLWPGKPLIGIDYAMLRGQSIEGGEAGVAATISTGMIGQGVVNFGRILGPAFAALLMSFWVAILARLDLHGQEVGRIQLYGLGLILTFNLGRDITFITLYTFVFGLIVVWWLDRKKAGQNPKSRPGGRETKPQGVLSPPQSAQSRQLPGSSPYRS